MKFAHFFVDRPIFATVVSLVIVIIGLIAFGGLPVSQYPEIAPPSIVVQANYPGANAQTVARTVATPLEQEINGVEGMLYMSSYATSDGSMSLTVTFKLGTDLDTAQVLVQNRVAIAEPRLPEDVRRLGVTTTKSSPDLMMVVHMLSPDESYDQLYVSNYAKTRVRDILLRLQGVGSVRLFGEREYSLRIWLDPEKLQNSGLTAGDVVQALREQNVQVTGGALGTPPNLGDNAFQFIVTTQGRFEDVKQFKQVIVKASDTGRLIRLQDVARVELGAKDYITNSYLNGKPAVALGIFQRPGTNALETAEQIISTMEQLKLGFPLGLDFQIIYNPTEFIEQSIFEVYKTLFEAALLVVLVIVVFLQSWRAAIIPIVAIPVSLIGTFAIMSVFGFSLNTLTLFGLILAIGIVVDDAIVVVENVERNISAGLSPREATHRTIDEVASALVATTLVLVAVFIPTAFIPGISGQFYQQFALTIAVSTLISTLNSLTLSPALAALLLKPRASEESQFFLFRWAAALSRGFNSGFDKISGKYALTVGMVVRRRFVMLLIYAGLVGGAVHLFDTVPRGFIPPLDQGYAIVVVQLPDGAALARTDDVVQRATQIIRETPGVKHAVAFAGFSGATFTNASNTAAIFTPFESYDERREKGLSAEKVIGQLFGRLQAIQEAFIIAIPPPPVRGVGNAGGFKLQLQERSGDDSGRVLAAAYQMMGQARQTPGVIGVFTTFSGSSPQLYLEIDRTKARMLNVPIPAIFETLQVNLGTAYVNDFNAFGRVYQVRAQADQSFRLEREDISRLKVRSATGALVPLGTLVEIRDVAGPDLIQRYNMYPSVPIQGSAAPGVSTGEALDIMEAMARQMLPQGVGFEWTELALQERQTGDTAIFIFILSIVFVFLVLAAQYESWVLPLAIILIVPMSLLSALLGVMSRGMDNNILTQIGLVVLVALAAKNAILIVEFAEQQEDEGKDLISAVINACRLRLRPILMTAFSFILGVLPLVIATGPGAEMRQALGTAVFSGMLGVTLFGLLLTPVFYVVLRALRRRSKAEETADAS
ncbi:MAG: multidrug efflux RND transporter permease subunit [Alphaproteobacteria bacterium]|nr:multidrug efflux RND transporter permease subunit [Alphaproteobacteria bacterium]